MSKTYKMGGGWGNRIEPSGSWEKRRVVGWKRRIPRVDDLLEANMANGRTGVFRFISIERFLDPPDMFFAMVQDVGYKEEMKPEAGAEAEGGEGG